jgi:glycosyltransferase involved in cell wall biosynthesis
MPTVIVYRSLLLPRSETFIKAQIGSYQRWRAVLLGRRLCRQLPLDGLDWTTFEDEGAKRVAQILLKLRLMLGISPDVSSLRSHKPALMHAHFGMDALEAAPVAHALQVPLAVTLHGFDINIDFSWWRGGHAGLLMRGYPRRLLKLASQRHVHFIAVSNAIKARAITAGIPERKIDVRYIGVDRAQFSPGIRGIAERPPRVLFVGRLVEKKGCEYLLRAMQIVGKAHPTAELVIVGDGPLRSRLEVLARELGVSAIFRGFVAGADVRKELENARVFCLPSVTAANGDAEGLAIVLFEAQASGVPVVTSGVGGTLEGIVDGQTGYAFMERDVPGLAAKLSAILGDDELAQRMSAAGPKFVAEKFDIRLCTNALESLYDDLTRQPTSVNRIP